MTLSHVVLRCVTVQRLTAGLLRVALLDVLAGSGRAGLAAIRTAEVLQVSPEGFQAGVDAGACPQYRLLPVGQGFVFVHLRQRFCSHAIIQELQS